MLIKTAKKNCLQVKMSNRKYGVNWSRSMCTHFMANETNKFTGDIRYSMQLFILQCWLLKNKAHFQIEINISN